MNWIQILMILFFCEKLFANRDLFYSPIGKRNPFQPPVFQKFERNPSSMSEGLERFSMEQFRLKAILSNHKGKFAMFEDPVNQVHILQEGELLGREHAVLSKILRTDIIVTERTVNYLGVESLYERVLSIPKEE